MWSRKCGQWPSFQFCRRKDWTPSVARWAQMGPRRGTPLILHHQESFSRYCHPAGPQEILSPTAPQETPLLPETKTPTVNPTTMKTKFCKMSAFIHSLEEMKLKWNQLEKGNYSLHEHSSPGLRGVYDSGQHTAEQLLPFREGISTGPSPISGCLGLTQ